MATAKDVRKIFDEAIKAADPTDLDRITNLELLREFYTNQDFRQKLYDTVWEINQKKAQST